MLLNKEEIKRRNEVWWRRSQDTATSKHTGGAALEPHGRVLACLSCVRAPVPSSALQKGLGDVDKHTGETENGNVVHAREAKSFRW